MNLVDHYQLMAEYNRWMNEKLYGICATIPDAQRKQDLGAFFKSIHGTLNHILWGDTVWVGRFTGRSSPVPRMGEDLFADFAALTAERVRMDGEILGWARTLADADLARPLEFRSVTDHKIRRGPVWRFIAQLFNHQTHHRGQVTTLMKQLGYEPGITDIPYMPGVVQIQE